MCWINDFGLQQLVMDSNQREGKIVQLEVDVKGKSTDWLKNTLFEDQDV